MSENLFIPLFTAALWLMVRHGKLRDAECVCAGFLVGLGSLTRSVLVGFAPAGAIWLLATGEKRRSLYFLLGALVTIVPWSARNSLYHGRFVLIDTFSGYNFLVGNNPEATGRQYLPIEGPERSAVGGERRDDAEISSEGYRKGIEFIIEDPLRFFALGLRKTGYFFGPEGRELFWAYSKNYFGEVPRVALIPSAVAIVAAFPLLCLAAISGLLFKKNIPGRASRDWAFLLFVVAYFTAAHFVTFGESRFHLPLVPIFALFASRLKQSAADVAQDAPGRARLLLFAAFVWLLLLNTFSRLNEDWHKISAVLGPDGNAAKIDY